MKSPQGPTPPPWVHRIMDHTMTPGEIEEALGELADLHAHWCDTLGECEADRRYSRQARMYPLQLLRRLRPREPISRLARNLAQSARSLRRAPGLASAIVLTVGVGIGGCTAIFAVVDALFLKALPYEDPDRLVWVYTDAPPNWWPFSVVDFEALRDQQTRFDAVAAFRSTSFTFIGEQVAERIPAASVTPGFFELLGIELDAGRPPMPTDGEEGATPTALVTSGFAASRLGAAGSIANVVGSSIRLNDVQHTVIGVLSDEVGPIEKRARVITTLQLSPPGRRGPFFLRVFGRLPDDMDARTAEQEVRAINARVFPVWQDSYQDESTTWSLAPVSEYLNRDAGRLLAMLMAAVGMLLVIATANASSLLLARVGSRRRELALRMALGASRGGVVRHLLVESSLLAVAGGLVGIFVARSAIALMPVVAGGYLPRLDEVGLDARTWLFAAMLAVGSGLLFGLISALQGSGGNLGSTLKAAGPTHSGSEAQQRPQRLLVAGQLAIAVPLLTGAALLGASFTALRSLDVGFDAESTVSMRVSVTPAGYPDGAARQELWRMLKERISALPGVIAVSVSDSRPPQDADNINNFDLEDKPAGPGQNQPVAAWISTETDFFATLDIPLIEGRLLEPEDANQDAARVIVVDRSWADRHFPGESAVGRRLREGGATTGPWTTVVGVVGDVPFVGLGREMGGTVYAPWAWGLTSVYLHVRASADPAAVVPSVRAALRELDPNAPITEVATGTTLLSDSLAQPRHLTLILTGFSALAMILATIGLYGITAHWVQRRRGDIAIRIALGGSPKAVLAMVLRQGLGLAVAGLAVGAVAAVGVTPMMTSLLYEVSPQDPRAMAAVVGLLLGVSAVACFIPGRRAIGVDPGTALREE